MGLLCLSCLTFYDWQTPLFDTLLYDTFCVENCVTLEVAGETDQQQTSEPVQF